MPTQSPMRIAVIGAGAIGSAIAHDLAQREDVTEVRVCDAATRALQGLSDLVRSGRVRSYQVDGRDTEALVPILTDCDCVIGAMGPDLSPRHAELALGVRAHYCDLGGGESILDAEMALADAARASGRWVVPSCGLAPGLVNVVCLHGIEQFDSVDSAFLRVGDVPLHPEPPFNFRISWSAQKVLDDYTNPVSVIEDGRLVTREPLTEDEAISFAGPFANMEAFRTAGSLSLLSRELEGRVKRLDHKTVRWPGHAAQMRFLLGLGLAEPRTIDVRTHLTYRDILERRMRQRLGGEHEDAVLMRVVLHGKQDGRERSLVYEMIDRFDSETGLSAMRRATAFPTAAAALLLASGAVEGGGAGPPETVLPRDRYLSAVRDRGLDLQENWFDGHVPVAGPLPADR